MKDDTKKVESVSPSRGRRDVMKMGVGAAMAALGARTGLAQQGETAQSLVRQPLRGAAPELKVGAITRSGWTNNANRISGNGPMDETTRQAVEYVHKFSDANLTPPAV